MTKIGLVHDGIFPILYDENNKLIEKTLETGFKVSGCLQGEGKYVNVPSLFIRTSGCNLRCIFSNKNGKPNTCDTPYSSFKPDQNIMNLDVVANIIRNNIGNIKHLVITGGEPFLQSNPLVELLDLIKDLNLYITIETNGTIYDNDLVLKADLISLSPKLESSNPTWLKQDVFGIKLSEAIMSKHYIIRYNLEVLKKFCNSAKQVQLKFVITCQEDLNEVIEKYYNPLNGLVNSTDIYLMPEGITEKEIQEKSMWLMEECIKNGFTFCPRMHVLYFGGAKRSV